MQIVVIQLYFQCLSCKVVVELILELQFLGLCFDDFVVGVQSCWGGVGLLDYKVVIVDGYIVMILVYIVGVWFLFYVVMQLGVDGVVCILCDGVEVGVVFFLYQLCFYKMQIFDGIFYGKIVMLYGVDVLVIIILQSCICYESCCKFCQFCVIGQLLVVGCIILCKIFE